MRKHFGARLQRSMQERGPLCVGIDAHALLLRDWGLADDAGGLERFARTVVEALGGQVAVIKPQSAFFERFGSRGIAVLERVLSDTRDAGAIALLDAKRGDVGSTVEAYAQAYLDPASPLAADAVTASPYLGVGALTPLVETALRHDNGVFVLALTSNPEGAQVQRAVSSSGATVAADVLAALAVVNRGVAPIGSIGAVIGATLADLPADVGVALRELNGPVLAPGLGAQGAQPADLAKLFGGIGDSVVASYSRSLLAAGPQISALRAAAARAADECRSALSAH